MRTVKGWQWQMLMTTSLFLSTINKSWKRTERKNESEQIFSLHKFKSHTNLRKKREKKMSRYFKIVKVRDWISRVTQPMRQLWGTTLLVVKMPKRKMISICTCWLHCILCNGSLITSQHCLHRSLGNIVFFRLLTWLVVISFWF